RHTRFSRDWSSDVCSSDLACRQTQLGKGNDPLGVEEPHRANAVARGAGAHRVVEAEQARLEFRQAMTADRAGITAGIQVFAATEIGRASCRGRLGSATGSV